MQIKNIPSSEKLNSTHDKTQSNNFEKTTLILKKNENRPLHTLSRLFINLGKSF